MGHVGKKSTAILIQLSKCKSPLEALIVQRDNKAFRTEEILETPEGALVWAYTTSLFKRRN